MSKQKAHETDVPIILPTPIPYISQNMGLQMKKISGIPTCLSISNNSPYTVIGTSRGFSFYYFFFIFFIFFLYFIFYFV